MPNSARTAHPPWRGHALRRGRVSAPGQIYLLTIVTQQRQPLFSDFAAACIVAQALAHYRDADATQSLAWVVMPDHLHWLSTLGPECSLSELLRSFKSYTARQLNLRSANPGRRVWQRGFHDHALRREDDVRKMARYIVANPLRAGLVSRIGNYPFWDAVWL